MIILEKSEQYVIIPKLQKNEEFIMTQYSVFFYILIFVIFYCGENKPSLPESMNINKCKLVRDTCKFVFTKAQHIKFHEENLEALALKFNYTPFNQFQHHRLMEENKEEDEQVLLYLFTLDCLNFCFWPLEGFQYEHLAGSVKKFVEKSGGLEQLCQMNEQVLSKQMFGGIEVPLADERARILREMANIVKYKFQGLISKIIHQANKSAVSLLSILTSTFPNFQDHSIYKGHQIHFYKRPQILIGDIYAKFQGKSYGEFWDIHELTMFPDYRVPQILNQYKILSYAPQLQYKIDNKIPIQSGSQQQIQIRAASVTIVQKIKQFLKTIGKDVKSIQVDWFLWEEGEKNLKNIVNHHRTLTIYY